jgi:hypothetical protein
MVFSLVFTRYVLEGPAIFEVGKYSKRDDPKGGVVVYPRAVQDTKSCFHTIGVSFKGTEKGFLNFLILVDEGHCSVSVPKQKREKRGQ